MHENTQFLSSVVIGGAGLIATSLYQWNNSRLAQKQAEWQQSREEEKSKNDWRIERAKILAQNLQTLTTRGSDTAEQRYGVLLSLTRGRIIERDLAVSYALELGKDSPEDMRSVLSNIDDKDAHYYRRLAEDYAPTCIQRYGVSAAAMYVCRKDHLYGFSQGLAGAMIDDLNGIPDPSASPPLEILRDERYVQSKLLSLIGLYGEFVTDVYERRQWPILERFMNYSKGARLVATFDLLMESIEEANSSDQVTLRQRFDAGQAWLKDYMSGPSCDSECRGRLLSVLVSHLGNSPDHFPILLRNLLEGERFDVVAFISRLLGRLGYCQIDPKQLPVLRDSILIPALLTHVAKPQPDRELINDLLGLLETLPLPADSLPDWKKLQTELSRVTAGQQPKQFLERYAAEQRRKKALATAAHAQKTGAAPGAASSATPAPGSIRGTNFCPVVSEFQTQADDRDD
jgi:hypothetical protein